jgi:uncharacterized protein YcnI
MKNLLTKVSKMFFPSLFLFGLFGGAASAHVEVSPKTSTAGEEETYTVKVPSEKEVPTTKIVIKFAEGMEFDSYEPTDGWKVTTQKGTDGKVKSITYEAAGQGILPGQFQRFDFIAVNPDKPVKAAWDAYQYYSDGSVVEWTGKAGSKAPHSITSIVTTSTASESANLDSARKGDVQEAALDTAPTAANSTPFFFSLLSGAVSIIAFVFAARER